VKKPHTLRAMRRPPLFRRPFLAVFSLAVAVFIFPLPASAAPKILQFGNGTEPQDLDPHVVTGVPEHRLLDAFFEGLVMPSADGQSLAPGVAERWDLSEDRLTYTFHLRADARWSNGAPITAHDFVASYRRILSPTFAANYAYMLFLIAGAEDFFLGKITDFSRTGVRAIDDRTLAITLRQPTPFFLKTLTHYAWFPVHIPTIEKAGGLERKGTNWTRPENFVSNGAFVLSEWRPGQKIIAARSPTYWDRARVKLEEIHFHPVELADTEERMFRTGQLHVTNEVPLTKIAVYQREQPDIIRIEPWCGVYYYRFNIAKKPFDDVRVRRALALAVDRETLVKFVTRGGEQPAYHIVPPDVAGYTSQHRLSHDVAEARRLLAEAGYPGGKGLPKIELLYNTLEKHKIIGEALQQMWKKNLGVTVTLYNQEWKVYIDNQKSGNFQFQRAGWLADYVDPHVFLDLWQSGGGNNNTGWGKPEYDQLLTASLDTKTEEARYAIYQRMEKMLIEEMPILPLYFYTRVRLISPKVLHYHTTYLDNFPWKEVDLTE
jgi:oligopeptide transport system substrate-binding protein